MPPALRQTTALLLAGLFGLSLWAQGGPVPGGEGPGAEVAEAVAEAPREDISPGSGELPAALEAPAENAAEDAPEAAPPAPAAADGEDAAPAEGPAVLHLYSGDALPDLADDDWAQTAELVLELHASLYTGDGDGPDAPLSFVVPEGKTVTLRSSPLEDASFVLTSGHTAPSRWWSTAAPCCCSRWS